MAWCLIKHRSNFTFIIFPNLKFHYCLLQNTRPRTTSVHFTFSQFISILPTSFVVLSSISEGSEWPLVLVSLDSLKRIFSSDAKWLSRLFQVPPMGPALSRSSAVLSDSYSMLHAAYLHPATHPYLHKAEPFFLTPGTFELTSVTSTAHEFERNILPSNGHVYLMHIWITSVSSMRITSL
jgi:hypothetical protein